MTDATELCTIGEFSRLVGVTPSALRYYDDCGLLVPARTDARTGYRFYGVDQRRRAELIRLLRDAGVALDDVRRVVDDPRSAATVLAAHGQAIAAHARAATAALGAAWRLLEPGGTTVRVSGPELASGIRQVAPAVAPAGSPAALAGMRVELAPGEVRLVASDRYRLALRTLPAALVAGAFAAASVDPAALRRLVPALLSAGTVSLRGGAGDGGAPGDGTPLTCEIDGSVHQLAAIAGTFPDYRAVVDQWVRTGTRLVVGRAALGRLLAPERTGPVVGLGPGGPQMVAVEDVRRGVRHALPGVWRGRRTTARFDTRHLAAAVAGSVGPDVLIDLADGPLPATVRSADHGSFTTVVMPRAQEEHDGPGQPRRAAVRAGHGGRAGRQAR